jgi:hypothetical protein
MLVPTPQLRNRRDFLRLMAGSSASMLGSRLTTIAYPLLVLSLHGSAMTAGLAVFAANAPSVLVYIPAGAFVDRWDDPRRTMLLFEAGRGIAIAIIVASLLMSWVSIPLIIGVAIIEESLEVFAMLAERRYVRCLVEPVDASSAQVSIEARSHVVVLAGRALGGLLFGMMHALPFLADALSFVASVAALLGIGHGRKRAVRLIQAPPTEARSAEEDQGLASEVREGLRELFKDPFARDASLLSAGMTLVSQALIIVFLAAAHLGQVPTVLIGSVLAASGIGGLLGALVGKWVRTSANWSPLKFQPLIWAVMLAVLALSGRWQLPAMALVMLVLGLAGAMGNVELDTYLVQKVPDKKLARVTSIEMLLDFAASALGPAVGGLLTEVCGTRHAVWFLCASTAPFAVLGLRLRLPGSPVGKVHRAGFKVITNLLVEAAIMSLLVGVALMTLLVGSHESAGRGGDQDLSLAGRGGDQDRGLAGRTGAEAAQWSQHPVPDYVGQFQAR